MKEVLLTLLSLTLSGSLLCVLVLLLRPVTGNRVPRAVSYYLWLAVLLRFLIPLGYGITLPQLPQPTQEMVQQETILPDRQDQTDTQTAPITPPSEPVTVDQPEITQPSAPAISLPGMLVSLWLAVGAGFFFWHIAAYARFSRRVRTSLAPPTAEALALFEELGHGSRVRLAQSGQVDAPMLLGVFRPVIVLPQGGPSLPPQALAAALRHELTHARRWDICYKWLVVLVASLHWFNPLVHWMGRRIALDCELSCDEAVLRALEPEQRMAYGDMLLLLAARPGRPSPWMAAPLCQKGKRLKARLLGIKGYRRPGKAAICLTLVLGLAVACCACTVVDMNPQPRAAAGESDPYQPLLIEYELAFLQQQPDLYPDLVSAVIAPYWGQDHQLGYARRDLDGDSSEELLLGWVGNEFWNLDQGYVFAIYTLVDGQPVLAVEGWERNRYVVGEDGYLYNAGSSGADQHEGNKYRFDPSRADFLELVEQTHDVETEDRWMAPGTAIAATPLWEESLPAGFEGVLLGEEPILYVADGAEECRPVYIGEVPALFSPDSPYAAVGGWAAVDLDGDGTAETVLQITDVGNDMGGYLILRRKGDRVYGYPSGWRTFWSLKTDGTFLCSEWAGTKESIVSLRFTDGGYEQVEHLTAEGEQFIFTSFTVEGRQVTEEEWQAAWDAQEQKPDAWWYALPEKTE